MPIIQQASFGRANTIIVPELDLDSIVMFFQSLYRVCYSNIGIIFGFCRFNFCTVLTIVIGAS